jgi:hypothetical protein
VLDHARGEEVQKTVALNGLSAAIIAGAKKTAPTIKCSQGMNRARIKSATASSAR